MCDVVNAQGKILDLVFCSDPDNVRVMKITDTVSRIDYPFHEATEIRFTIADHNSVKPNEKSSFYGFKDADFDALNNYLPHVDWEFIFESYSSIS